MDNAFKALAHPARRKILSLLREREMTAGELAEHFDFSKPTLSGHFAILKEADLVTTERKGTSIVYQLNISVSEEIIAAVLDIVGDRAQSKRAALDKGKKPSGKGTRKGAATGETP